MVIPPEVVCLEMSTMHVLALDYLVAFYPLILIVFTYILIELHAQNFWPLVWVWKPVQYCFARCGIKRQWNFKSSIIEAFASFLLLSFGKMLSISFDLLVPTLIYTENKLTKCTCSMMQQWKCSAVTTSSLPS